MQGFSVLGTCKTCTRARITAFYLFVCDKTHRSLFLSLPFAQIEISVHGSSCIHLSRLSCELLPGARLTVHHKARHAAYCGGNLALAQRTRLCLVHNFWHLLRFVVVVFATIFFFSTDVGIF